MGHSSLLGTETAEFEPEGRDVAALGPGDNSDSGSDVAGLDQWAAAADPTEPVDVALRADRQRSAMPLDALAGGSGDAAGTGERRSAGADAGLREAADISVDRIFDTTDPLASSPTDELPGAEGLADPDPDDADEEEEEDEDEELTQARGSKEDESADPVGDGHSDADLARRLQDGRQARKG
jgi:hypothetical protein